MNSKTHHYDVQVLFVSVKEGVVSTDESFVELCKGLLHSKGFVFCPGIDYQKYHDSYYLFSDPFSQASEFDKISF